MGAIAEFHYLLPEELIALHPLERRDHARLLRWEKGKITHHQFLELPALLEPGVRLFFNDTRVIPARIRFQKSTGAVIEIFLLHPEWPTREPHQAMVTRKQARWICTIGNLKRWPEELELRHVTGLGARLLDREKGLVEFSWAEQTFSEILIQTGETPLPPYLKRKVAPQDAERYQTVYSRAEGAVAAPTAGLHFTPELLDVLKQRQVSTSYLTLHVSAGTFQPVKAGDYRDHRIHAEQIRVSRAVIREILESPVRVAVGTTSLRTLETLYWCGVYLVENQALPDRLVQEFPYLPRTYLPTMEESCQRLLNYLEQQHLEMVSLESALYIMPGYHIRSVKGLITNFHQPGSTLLLLIAAITGDEWKKIYAEAIAQNYRFLSYGDSSLLQF